MDVLLQVGPWAGFILVWVLCLTGIVLSGLTFSGTWLVLGATALAAVLRDGFPGWKTLLLYGVICFSVEAVEMLASAWGVKQRGGSSRAGFAAMAGGLVGLLVGSAIPIPVVGSLLGLFSGCFLGAFTVEYMRLKEHGKALHIAWGAVSARVIMLCLKLVVTMGMTAGLALGMAF